ncbi:methyltransferase domain-containing protein [Tyzzerella sp. OttesenSCG-928-J15]|nr:methyltransferase domain-containing protein [Tyzzerella sp. OttesenSCG-928-J15]
MYKTIDVAHSFVKPHISQGDICIDATCGAGFDTAFLSTAAGAYGKVLSFDIQHEAIETAKLNIADHPFYSNITFINSGHQHIDEYAEKATVSCIMFNLGWLPGGNHEIRTKTQTTISAITKSLTLIKPTGIISLCLYCGKEMGHDEKKAVLEFAKKLPSEFDVIYIDYLNKNNPPTNLFIVRKY